MALVIQSDKLISFSRQKQPPEMAVADMLTSIQTQEINYLTFDLKNWSAMELHEWLLTFKRLFQTQAIDRRLATTLPAVAVFADHFTEKEETLLRDVGAILFDRSLPCNKDCETPEKLVGWLEENEKITLAASGKTRTSLEKVSEKQIDERDLKALNSYPAGTNENDVRKMLTILNSQ